MIFLARLGGGGSAYEEAAFSLVSILFFALPERVRFFCRIELGGWPTGDWGGDTSSSSWEYMNFVEGWFFVEVP